MGCLISRARFEGTRFLAAHGMVAVTSGIPYQKFWRVSNCPHVSLHAHARKYSHNHTCTHTLSHAHTHMHTHTHTHTHIHTHRRQQCQHVTDSQALCFHFCCTNPTPSTHDSSCYPYRASRAHARLCRCRCACTLCQLFRSCMQPLC